MDPNLLIDVQNLRVSFRTDEGIITPVEHVNYRIKREKTLGIVGESGSGKSVSTRALIKLLPKNAIVDPESKILFNRGNGTEPLDINLLPAGSKEIRKLRGGEIAMIFQEPMASFSPVYTIGNQIMEAVRTHRLSSNSPLAATSTVGTHISESLKAKYNNVSKKEARSIAVDMLRRVGIANADLRVDQYPHELSGGMRQRAMIAVALSTHPSILIADEPTTALDVTIQAQILELMKELQTELGMSIIFITHDMGVIAQVADEIAVMYLGTIVERGPKEAVINDPLHPYTKGILRAIPKLNNLGARLEAVGGDIPGPHERPTGCPFHPRCPQRITKTCDKLHPERIEKTPEHFVRCFLHL
ncbi:MAG: ABC transporter ATP-binding protein [Desulfobulbaceae bacterium]|nr:MAG: ABC transporter ATP-binding protein [Desulfobulbaceae bacterium]